MAYLSYRYPRRDLRLPPVDAEWEPGRVVEADEIIVEPCHAPPPASRLVAMARLVNMMDGGPVEPF
jgi:hypothetical protein